MASKKLALLKWCGRLDDKTYTPGIPIEWIRNFDYADYQSGESSSAEVYAVEWRDSKKPPKGGWKLYDAYVIHVSERRRVLDDKLRVLEGLVSPYKVITKNVSKPQRTKGQYKKVRRIVSSDESDSGTRDEEISGVGMLPESPELKDNHTKSATKSSWLQDVAMNKEQDNTGSSLDIFDSGNEIDKDDVRPKTSSPQDYIGPRKLAGRGQSEITTSVPSTKITLEKVMDKLDIISNQLNNIAQLLTSDEKNSGLILSKGARKVLPGGILGKPGPSQPTHKNIHTPKEGEFTEGDIEIGQPGSKVLVTDMQWATACSTNTFTAMTVSLLLAAFPLETLLRNNYKGGASRLNKGEDDAGLVRQALDKHVIEAIKYSVRSQYPTTFKEGEFGSAINVKLNKLRRKHLK